MDQAKFFVRLEDKVILSDLLFFVYNGFLNQPKNAVVETCVAFYSEETIWNEKTRFFDAVGKKANPRRSNDRKNNKSLPHHMVIGIRALLALKWLE